MSAELKQLRLECLKLAHTHGITPNEVLGKAEMYVKFVLAPSEVVEKAAQNLVPSKDQKSFKGRNSGNADILS